MKNINFKKEWNLIISEIHREKPQMDNLLKRELLFAIQNLLIQISIKSKNKEKAFLRELYLRAKGLYFTV